MRKYLTAGAIGAILTPVTIDADGKVGKLTALTTGQIDGFVGFSGQRSSQPNQRINVHVEGDLYPGSFVRGEEYYLSLTGPVLRSSLTDGTLTRLLGRAESSTGLRLKFGSLETIGGATGASNFLRVTSYRATSSYPADAAAGEWLDCGGAGGVVNAPASAALDVGDTFAVCQTNGGALTVSTTDATTINGAATFGLSKQWEQYKFFWTGAEWRVHG